MGGGSVCARVRGVATVRSAAKIVKLTKAKFCTLPRFGLNPGVQVFRGIIIREMLPCTRIRRARREGEARARASSQTLHARNSSKEPLRAFSFFITRELKIETGLDRDPEIDRGHHSYKRHTIQEYSVCTV